MDLRLAENGDLPFKEWGVSILNGQGWGWLNEYWRLPYKIVLTAP